MAAPSGRPRNPLRSLPTRPLEGWANPCVWQATIIPSRLLSLRFHMMVSVPLFTPYASGRAQVVKHGPMLMRALAPVTPVATVDITYLPSQLSFATSSFEPRPTNLCLPLAPYFVNRNVQTKKKNAYFETAIPARFPNSKEDTPGPGSLLSPWPAGQEAPALRGAGVQRPHLRSLAEREVPGPKKPLGPPEVVFFRVKDLQTFAGKGVCVCV